MSIVNAQGTTKSGGRWIFLSFNAYPIGDKQQVLYETKETRILVNDTATIYIGDQKIVKIESNLTNAIEFEVNTVENAVVITLNNADIGIVNTLDIR